VGFARGALKFFPGQIFREMPQPRIFAVGACFIEPYPSGTWPQNFLNQFVLGRGAGCRLVDLMERFFEFFHSLFRFIALAFHQHCAISGF
jgi:hypothetical protein